MYGLICLSCLTLITIEARVLKEIMLPPEGLSMDIIMRSNSKAGESENRSLAAMTISLRKDKVIISTKEEPKKIQPTKNPRIHNNPTTIRPLKRNYGRRVETTDLGYGPLPEIENRFLFRGAKCPTGYVRQGDICFPIPQEDPEPEPEPDED